MLWIGLVVELILPALLGLKQCFIWVAGSADTAVSKQIRSPAFVVYLIIRFYTNL